MPELRKRGRPASSGNNVASDPPKKQPKRGKKDEAPQPISDDEDAAPRGDTKNQAKGKTGAKASASHDTNLNIPIDEGCAKEAPGYYVFVDSKDDTIYDASLNQTNAGDNKNKFYRVQVLTDGKGSFRTWTRWGRVGEFGQSKLLGDGSLDSALNEFDKKFKDKSGWKWKDRGGAPKPGKYVFVERSYEPDSESESNDQNAGDKLIGSKQERSREVSPPKCSLEAPVKSLMELIFNQQYMMSTMADLNYDAEKLPLGKLSKATISRGYEALKGLSELFADPELASSTYNTSYVAAVQQLSNQYYSFIPHAFGRNRPPVISEQNLLKREVELLDSLTDMKAADIILKLDGKEGAVHPLDVNYRSLRMREMTAVDSSSDEFAHVSGYLTATKGYTHDTNYEVLDVFRIEREGEMERFQAFAKSKSNRRLLWHGSRSTNYGGILSQGLRIAPPEAPVSGYMFGKGIYLADMSSKSANYCNAHSSGGQALLLLCEAELGDPMLELMYASYSAGDDAKSQGMHSTWGKGSTGPHGWKDAGCIHPSLAGVIMPDTATSPGDTNVDGASLMYNEYICYDSAQVRLRYLLRVKM